MRTIGIAGALIAFVAADGAGAQRVVAHGPGGGYAAPQGGGYDTLYASGPQARTVGPRAAHRWGSKVGGRWWGGVNAPGGWNGYRRPHRGYVLPGYWVSPRFGIDDWSTYGLSQPPYGYRWMRYYDDAVLVDAGGSVYDTVGGLDWDRDGGGYDGDDTVYAGPGDRGAYAPGPQPSYGADDAIDRSSRRRGPPYGAGYDQPPVAPRHAPPPPRAGYVQPVPPEYGYAPPPPPPPHGGTGGWTSPDGRTTVTTTSAGYYGGSTTTVVVQTAPVVTTTTTELIEDDVTYTRAHRKWRRPASKVHVRCGC